MKRTLLNGTALLFVAGIAAMIGCTTSTSKSELELSAYDPAQDHGKIAAYYAHEAAKLRQTAEEMSVRIVVYERLFGPTSDWVSGTRLLTQSYQEAAKEYERKAHEHRDLIHRGRPQSGVVSELRDVTDVP